MYHIHLSPDKIQGLAKLSQYNDCSQQTSSRLMIGPGRANIY